MTKTKRLSVLENCLSKSISNFYRLAKFTSAVIVALILKYCYLFNMTNPSVFVYFWSKSNYSQYALMHVRITFQSE